MAIPEVRKERLMNIGRTMIARVLGFLPLWQDFAVASNLAMANTVFPRMP